MQTLGLIGVGLVGTAIAERLLAAGHRVCGFDLAADGRERLSSLGGEAAESAMMVAARCDCVILSLPSSHEVRDVLDACGGFLRLGRLWIDTSTGEPKDARRASEFCRQRGASYADATLLGSSEDIRAGQAVAMVGATAEDASRVEAIVNQFAGRVYYVGECGRGAELKLVVNLVLGLNRAALAEGLSLAQGLGFDLTLALDVLASGAAYSRVMDTKGPKMLAGDFTPQARLAQHHKDVGLIRRAAAQCHSPTPLSDAHEALLARAIAAGWGALDNSAVFKVYDAIDRTSVAPTDENRPTALP